ncbi:MAG: hypothetical protein AB7S40_08875 [Bacteroidales bacterium]
MMYQNDKIEKTIHEIISLQKGIEVSPFLKNKVMSKVEEATFIYERKMQRYLNIAYYCCFAISMLCSVYLGSTLGKSYTIENASGNAEQIINVMLDSGVENIESQFILFYK